MSETGMRRPPLDPPADFGPRHLGVWDTDLHEMLSALGVADLDSLTGEAVPASIRLDAPLDLPPATAEAQLLEELRRIVGRNEVWRSLIGMGYHDTHVPAIIRRNILENPGWYTQYTPYQAEISQGRLEALLNFQTMVTELTGLQVANASMLDEATACAEAMTMVRRVNRRSKSNRFFASTGCHPQTLALLQTRAEPLGIELVVDDPDRLDAAGDVFGVLLQVPDTWGRIQDYRPLVERGHAAGAHVIVACDLLALTLFASPGDCGADVAVGSAQRFGVPLFFGGPHAGFMAASEEFKRQLPGRIVGVSKDTTGRVGLRLALQTREQHIRRERATSNICTAQVLLAVMAGAYAVYHGPDGLRAIAERVHHQATVLAEGLKRLGFEVSGGAFFDTLRVHVDGPETWERVARAARSHCLNFRTTDPDCIGLALDETTGRRDLTDILDAFGHDGHLDIDAIAASVDSSCAAAVARRTPFLEHPVFHAHQTETEMLRYLRRLEGKDLSLTTSMIPLGSCTMKLNATSELLPVSWPELSSIHPFAPPEQWSGYRELLDSLARMLSAITGFPAFSLQPNAGSQGEYAGLLVIRAFHRANGQAHRDVCLIPESAHGTNPASAVMAGMRVVVVACDEDGNVDLEDLRRRAAANANELAALMITYPSTHGVFEEAIEAVCQVVHDNGGQVYLDGANLNAQVGLCRPADYGADVCHLNLHKTFSIPHGGGGPGVGPIGVAAHLEPFLPGHPLIETGGDRAIGPVSAAPFGSAGILPISWMYIRLLGVDGVRRASQVAILNANYMAQRLEDHYPILYRGARGRVAHEFILDCRRFERSAQVRVEDIAKRLMDYGFHAPTMSWPIAGTLMVEPTESECRAELDRFCDAMIAIRQEIAEIEAGAWPTDDNPLVNAPHPAHVVSATEWPHPYSRERAAYPLESVRDNKFWPPTSRIDNAYGDRNLICTCPGIDAYSE